MFRASHKSRNIKLANFDMWADDCNSNVLYSTRLKNTIENKSVNTWQLSPSRIHTRTGRPLGEGKEEGGRKERRKKEESSGEESDSYEEEDSDEEEEEQSIEQTQDQNNTTSISAGISDSLQQQTSDKAFNTAVTDSDDDDELEDLMQDSDSQLPLNCEDRALQNSSQEQQQYQIRLEMYKETISQSSDHKECTTPLISAASKKPSVRSTLPPLKQAKPSASKPMHSVPKRNAHTEAPTPPPKVRASHPLINIDKDFIKTAAFVDRPGVGQVYDWKTHHQKNVFLAKQKKEQKRAQTVIEAAKKTMAYENESKKAFQQWLEMKKGQRQQQVQDQMNLIILSSLPVEYREEPHVLNKRENHWHPNFGMAAFRSAMFGRAKPLHFGMDAGVQELEHPKIFQ